MQVQRKKNSSEKYSELKLEEKVEILSNMSTEDIKKLHKELAQKKINEETLRKDRPVKIGNLKPKF